MQPNRKTVFIVDDNETNLQVAKQALNKDYKVVTLISGAMMFNQLTRSSPDLILLDVEMPEEDGYTVLRRLRSEPQYNHIPVIFLTARSDEASELEGFKLGAVDFISKPFSIPTLLRRIETHLFNAASHHDLDIMVREKTSQVLALQSGLLSVVSNLIESRDFTTGGHVERTQGYLSLLIDGMIAGNVFPEERKSWNMEWLLPSAQLHDVGKIRISDLILNKRGKLTPQEFEIMKTHAAMGEEIISHMEVKLAKNGKQEFLEYAKTFAGAHHEKWDGSGYPRGLMGEKIPLLGRILAIADVYDALTHVRSYKEAMPREQAAEIIFASSGSHFDPQLVEVFRTMESEFAKLTVAEDAH
ncbi:MAG: response regulator [Oscillospiraceae bacterium]|nr:response regulator [Oscillospiraceae bacterium]